MHQLNPGQCLLRRVKTLESQHRTALAFDLPVILFDDVVEVLTLPFYLDVGFIEPPSVTGSLLFLVKDFLQLRRVMNHPALDGAVVDLEPAFLHDLFNVTIAQ